MKIIQPNSKILTTKEEFDNMLKNIEIAGRTCYKSEDKITADSAEKFVTNLIKRGHEAMIEHQSITVRIICDRGISHEVVRHRVASYAQESTRYCNYSQDKFGKEITVIEPYCFTKDSPEYSVWYDSCSQSEKAYNSLIEIGVSPQMARSILPNSLKTEIVVTMNLREWRHFFKLRCDKSAHPQMRQVSIPLLLELRKCLPIVFDDIEYDKDFDVTKYAQIVNN